MVVVVPWSVTQPLTYASANHVLRRSLLPRGGKRDDTVIAGELARNSEEISRASLVIGPRAR